MYYARYWGDEAQQNNENDASTSLQSLLTKIEERRKRQKPVDSASTSKSIPEVKPPAPRSEEPALKKQKTNDSSLIASEEPVESADSKSVSRNDDFTIISSIEFKKNQKVR